MAFEVGDIVMNREDGLTYKVVATKCCPYIINRDITVKVPANFDYLIKEHKTEIYNFRPVLPILESCLQELIK